MYSIRWNESQDAEMMSRLCHYLNEIVTCGRVAASPPAFAGLVKSTGQFHLRNLLGRGSSDPAMQPEKHQIVLGANRRDVWLRPGTGDWFIFHEIFTNKCYRIPESILPQARTIVDLGANIGLTTLFLSQFFPDARYVCVEPNPLNAAILRRNVAFLGNRVTILECAIADYCGDISFSESDWSWGSHIQPDAGGGSRVACSTVDNVFHAQQIEFADLVKVDIEGAERFIFSGKASWLAKVGCVVVELHGGYSFLDFGKDVASFGFEAIPEGSVAGNVMHMAVSRSGVR
jgi:FkbM family methyltransferase